MLNIIGTITLFLALGISILSAIRINSTNIQPIRIISAIFQCAPFLILTFCFLIEDTSNQLVSQYVGEGLPIFYRISAVWGSRVGPILMWASIMAIITLIMSGQKDTSNYTIQIMHSWITILFLVSLFLDPFSASDPGSRRGEISPLLQTDLMVIHPPVVFLYYSLCLATATIAVSGVIRTETPEKIHSSMIQWARYSLLAGSVGIGLGGLWAYTVLDWGGYWAWDPVETGSLLPWLALLGILHARARSSSLRPFSYTPALAMISGALVFHATLVTRANGVWASVHAFVGDGENSLPRDPYIRVVEIIDFSAIGFEILTYLVAVVGLLSLSFIHLIREQLSEIGERGSRTFFDKNKTLSVLILVYFTLVSLWIGSSFVIFFGLSILMMLVFGDAEKPSTHWVSLGVILMLFSSWAWITEWYQSLAGIGPFLLIWIIPEEDKEELSWIWKTMTNPISRYKLSRSFPWYLSIVFLLLTWILLTVEIDGTNIAAHEYYGAPLISLLAVGLALYSWGNHVSGRLGLIYLVIATIISVVSAIFSDSINLPGNPNLPITDNISRGNLSVFILTWLFFALPATLVRLWKSARKRILFSGRDSMVVVPKTRLLGTHLAHAGVLILLIGHVLTTTLVDRSDPSNFITLKKNSPTEYRGMDFVFTEIELISPDDDSYEYQIADGYVGVVIEVREGNELLGELRPGVLRFDTTSQIIPRSEVDRMSTMTGDTIAILDLLQSGELLSSMILSQTDPSRLGEIEEVRVTIHHLPGSHLVWIGWILIILGSIFSSKNPYRSDESEE
ncbi:MAG: hypothetical protein CMB61_00060 [Euryarchaeota archaeon]|nr:hypothetical protein [Euryarchaeota archaeon]